MIHFKDQVRTGHILGGSARDFVRRLYPEPKDMDPAVERDEKKFLAALGEAVEPFLKVGPDARKDIRDLPEPISAIARWYLVQELGPEEVARELGLRDAKKLQAAIEFNNDLRQLGLGPLAQGATIKREAWESLAGFTSPFQEAARQLRRGTPFRVQ